MNVKRTLHFIWSLVLLAIMTTSAQAQDAFKYQAVARDASGLVLANQSVSFQISILEGGVSGTTVYSETHAVNTNDYGLVGLEVGSGVVGSGDFSTIDWGGDSHFLQVEMDATGGSNYQMMGTSQLLSVPYAIHAKTADSVPGDLDTDDTNELQDISLFGNELSLSNGSTVTLPDEVNDADADATNELQDISLNGYELSLSNGSTVTLIDAVNDADADATNEIELPAGGSNGQVLSTDGAGNYSWKDDEGGSTSQTYAIGDLAHGGIVFYVNPQGTHGLVAANQDQHLYETWYDAHDLLNDPTKHDAEGKKYFDWRLPSRWESTKMYQNLKVAGLGDIDDFGYWIDVESSPDKAYCEDMAGSGQADVSKTMNFLHVRTVRAF